MKAKGIWFRLAVVLAVFALMGIPVGCKTTPDEAPDAGGCVIDPPRYCQALCDAEGHDVYPQLGSVCKAGGEQTKVFEQVLFSITCNTWRSKIGAGPMGVVIITPEDANVSRKYSPECGFPQEAPFEEGEIQLEVDPTSDPTQDLEDEE